MNPYLKNIVFHLYIFQAPLHVHIQDYAGKEGLENQQKTENQLKTHNKSDQ